MADESSLTDAFSFFDSLFIQSDGIQSMISVFVSAIEANIQILRDRNLALRELLLHTICDPLELELRLTKRISVSTRKKGLTGYVSLFRNDHKCTVNIVWEKHLTKYQRQTLVDLMKKENFHQSEENAYQVFRYFKLNDHPQLLVHLSEIRYNFCQCLVNYIITLAIAKNDMTVLVLTRQALLFQIETILRIFSNMPETQRTHFTLLYDALKHKICVRRALDLSVNIARTPPASPIRIASLSDSWGDSSLSTSGSVDSLDDFESMGVDL